jgi:hypothetical protein
VLGGRPWATLSCNIFRVRDEDGRNKRFLLLLIENVPHRDRRWKAEQAEKIIELRWLR